MIGRHFYTPNIKVELNGSIEFLAMSWLTR